MKQKGLIIATVVFFLLVNTTFLWEGSIGIVPVIMFLLLLVYFLVLTGLFLREGLLLFKKRNRLPKRFVSLGVMLVVLVLTALFPKGLLHSEIFGSRNVLIARLSEEPHCTTIIKLKANHRFREKSGCYNGYDIRGGYIRKGDTIFFEKISPAGYEKVFYRYAVITKYYEFTSGGYSSYLVRFINYSDSLGDPLPIVRNKLR